MAVTKIKHELFSPCKSQKHDICVAVLRGREYDTGATDALVCTCPCHVRREWER
jgi:hypothetical protein